MFKNFKSLPFSTISVIKNPTFFMVFVRQCPPPFSPVISLCSHSKYPQKKFSTNPKNYHISCSNYATNEELSISSSQTGFHPTGHKIPNAPASRTNDSCEKTNGKSRVILKTPDEGNYQDFKEMLEANFIYVDKTDLLYKIVKLKTAFILNSERRTGKTLLLSTIKAMFQQSSEWWQQYGADLKIMQLDPNFFAQNPYPVIEFSFSQCPNNERFLKDIISALNYSIITKNLRIEKIPENLNIESLVAVKFNEVLAELKTKYNKPVVITIDEADQPLLNQMFSERIKDEKERAEKMGVTIDSFNQFYGFLKDKLARGIVRLVFVAGHSLIAKSSIYSAFNNPVILRNCPQFHNLLGFTREEILLNFKDQMKTIAQNQKKTEDQLMLELEQHYNGYKYNVEANETLFNAFVIQNFFNSNGKFRNYFAESGGTKILLKSLNQQEIPDLRNYLNLLSDPAKRVQRPIKELTTPKDWKNLQKDFKQLSFDAGYLTIADVVGDQVNLKIPNKEVFENMQELLRSFLIKSDKFGRIMANLKNAQFKDLFENLIIVAFKDKTFLKLDDKGADIRRDADYEVFLHQLVTMTFRLALKTEKEKNFIKDYLLENEKQVPEKTRLDLFIGIEGRDGFLFEFGLRRQKKNSNKCIEAVFEKKYYEIFNAEEKTYQSKFVIGVEMDGTSSEIIAGIKVLKLKQGGKIENREDWIIDYEK